MLINKTKPVWSLMYCWCGSNDSIESNIARGWVADFIMRYECLRPTQVLGFFFLYRILFRFRFVSFWFVVFFLQLNKFSAVWNLDWRQMKRILKGKNEIKVFKCCCFYKSVAVWMEIFHKRGGIVPLRFQPGRVLQARARSLGDLLETCFCNILFRVDAEAEDKL